MYFTFVNALMTVGLLSSNDVEMMLTDVCGQCKYSIFTGTVLSMKSYMRYSRVRICVENQIDHGIGQNEQKREDSISAKKMTNGRCIKSLH